MTRTCMLAVVALVLVCGMMRVSAQTAPIISPTNPYFTPSKTFSIASTLQSVQGGQQTVITGVGPDASPGPYTWNYTLPQSTLQPTSNPALVSSLAKSFPIDASASNLQPDPEHVQVRRVCSSRLSEPTTP